MDRDDLKQSDLQKLKDWAAGKMPQRGYRGKRRESAEPEAPEADTRTLNQDLRRLFEEAGDLPSEEMARRISAKKQREKAAARQVRLRSDNDMPHHVPAPPEPAPQKMIIGGFSTLSEEDEIILEFRKGDTLGTKTPEDGTARREDRPRIDHRPPKWYSWDHDLVGVAPGMLKYPPSWKSILDRNAEHVSEDQVHFVGVDAGTSGIRVAAWNEYREDYHVFDFGENKAGGTRFSFPSLVGFDGNNILFGNEAVGAPWRQRFTSFKAGMLYLEQAKGMTEKWCNLGLPFPDSFSNQCGPRVPEFLYSVSIAKALHLSLPRLIERFREAFLIFTVGAPGDGWREDVGPRFHRCFATGVLLAGCMGRIQDAEDLIQRFARAWTEGKHLVCLAEEQRKLHVRHEAHLAVSSLNRLFREGRTFLIADIGATTTEVSVLRYSSRVLHRWVSRSLPIGVDQADLLTLNKANSRKDLVARRLARVSGKSRSTQDSEIGELAARLREQVKIVLRQAVGLNPDRPSWEEIHVAIAGGGANIPPLVDVFLGLGNLHDHVQRVVRHPLQMPQVNARGGSKKPPTDEELLELV